jgi:hypothetical protein
MAPPRDADVLTDLRKAAAAESQAGTVLRDLIVEVMSKPPRERGATTYELAEAIGKSRQQLHQIYRDATGTDPLGE